MPFWAWSWLLTAIGVTGLLVAGSHKAWGWLIGFGVQVLWVLYGLTTEQYGFIVSALVYASVYYRNYAKWAQGK